MNSIDPTGLWTLGFGTGFGFGFGTDSSGSMQVVFDSHGGIDVQGTLGVGAGYGASITGLNLQLTNAETVDELTGWSLEGVFPTGAITSAGVILGSTYEGFQLGIGLGAEGPFNATHTWSLSNQEGLSCDPQGVLPTAVDWWSDVKMNWWD